MTVPTSDHTVAQVIHALAVLADKGLLDESSWPAVARVLLDQGYRWQAAHDLAAMNDPEEYLVLGKLKDLAAQTELDLAGGPHADPWDVVAGLYGRIWRLGLLDAILAMWRMNHVWYHIRDLPHDHSRGVEILWTAMGLKELDDDHPSRDLPALAEALLAEADSLIEPGALSLRLCQAMREAMDAAGY
ncbi:hypothetical protein [Nocardia sp. NBC_00511]|uniref:hypothetical protein n=1 Tax=Nocardia sp. NBC_00511 TaxID=2903591 RepID=UPI0030DE1C62